MPLRHDENLGKWMYASTRTEDGIICGMELHGIHWNSKNAHSAQLIARRQGLNDVDVVRCQDENGEDHFVCIIGEFAIDHRQEWVVKTEDLPYTWP